MGAVITLVMGESIIPSLLRCQGLLFSTLHLLTELEKIQSSSLFSCVIVTAVVFVLLLLLFLLLLRVFFFFLISLLLFLSIFVQLNVYTEMDLVAVV